jgi:hypothetical protein
MQHGSGSIRGITGGGGHSAASATRRLATLPHTAAQPGVIRQRIIRARIATAVTRERNGRDTGEGSESGLCFSQRFTEQFDTRIWP